MAATVQGVRLCNPLLWPYMHVMVIVCSFLNPDWVVGAPANF